MSEIVLEWIHVKEILPEKNETVVIWDIEAGLNPEVGYFDPSKEGGGFYVRAGGSNVSHRVICTHYLILPKNPVSKSLKTTLSL